MTDLGPSNAGAIELLLQAYGSPELVEMDVSSYPADQLLEESRCFGNALSIVFRNPGYKLVLGNYWTPLSEGAVAWSDALFHAWVQEPDGSFKDPTWSLEHWRDRPDYVRTTYKGFVVPDINKLWWTARRLRRCAGTTKKGTPCKRQAVFPSEHCSLHGGFFVVYTDPSWDPA